MSQVLSDEEVIVALKQCDAEPIHTPGAIQPIGVLLGCHQSSGVTHYASANATELFGDDLNKVFGHHLGDLLGSEIWHNCRNFMAQPDSSQRRYFAGIWSKGQEDYSIHVSQGGDYLVVEIENATEMPALSTEMLRQQVFLINQLQACQDQASLFDLTCQLLRHVSGFDRVMIYKFDAQWNGQVHAEARKASMESFENLRFPHWDIPEQARAIMSRIQLRLISDVNYETVPLITQTADLPPLDIALAQSRAASELHMQYLRNMGTHATMTLSVVLDDELWGIISFHHQRPKIAPPDIRHILTTGVLPVFCLKLGLLRDRETMALSRRLDTLQADIQTQLENGTGVAELLKIVGPAICGALNVDGLVVATGSQNYSLGHIPSQAALAHLISLACGAEDGIVVSEALSLDLPDYRDQWGDLAGVFGITKSDSRCLLLFRRGIQQQVHWAGDPSKTIETVDGNSRLQPRGSFKRYLESIQGRCKSWSGQDRHMASQLWPLLSAVERQAFMSDISRQQSLMIDELNHRVRNILALVKSVSQRARKKNGSLESYSQALESRIMALAAAHQIGDGSAQSAVSIKRIIALESEPYDPVTRFKISGVDVPIRADIAPIVTLLIHELTTNAVKYGALSNSEGFVSIDITAVDNGVTLLWKEVNGPPVTPPEVMGFGTTLIEQAVPYELNGTSNIEFVESGVQAFLSLPASALDRSSLMENSNPSKAGDNKIPTFTEQINPGLVLILEDNFLIAADMGDELEKAGYSTVETCSSSDHALDFLQTTTPQLALLDVNLGQGKTSEKVATELIGRGVPIAFVTGYGDKLSMPPHLAHIPVLTKPISRENLRQCLSRLTG